MFSAFSLWAVIPPKAAFQLPVFWLWRGCQRQGTETLYLRHQVTGSPPHPCSPLPCPVVLRLPRVQRGSRTALGGSTLVSERRGSGGRRDYRVSRPGSAHQKNRREQRFAFCSGLGFTFGYSGGIVPARAGVERRCAALTSVRLPLLLEATAGMLETSPPSGSAGRALRTTGCWGWSTHHPPGLRLPGLHNLPRRLRVTGSALLSRPWEK